MKKVLLLSQVFLPETNAGAKRLGSMTEILGKHYDVYVITLKPSHPTPELYKTFFLERQDSERPFKIRRTFNFHPHKGGLVVRALREHLMVFRLAARAVFIPADIIVTSPPSMFFCPVGLLLARAKRAKFVCDVRDVTWEYTRESAETSPMVRFGMRVLKKYVLFALRRADLVVGVTPGITQVLIESGVASEKAVTISNGVSPDLLDVVPRTGKSMVRQRPIVAYAGLVGYNQGLRVLLEAAHDLPDVDFVLAGEGPELPLLVKRARELNLTNILFRGYLGKEELLKVYEECDILFAQLRNTQVLNRTGMPSKLFEYMATGRPFVYAGKGLAVDFLRKVDCAITVPPEDPEAIATALRKLLHDPELMHTLGEKGREFMRNNYHRNKLMQDLAHQFEERFGK